MKLLGIIRVHFDASDQILIRHSAFIRYSTKMEYNWTAH